jgi:sugar/nucleoside kinase (ribokinase family)
VIVDNNGENQIAVGSGANNAVTTAQLDFLEKNVKDHTLLPGDVLLQQMEIPMEEVRKAVEIARLIGAFSVLNVAPSAPVPEETLRKLDFLVVNEHEAADVFASLSETNEVAKDVSGHFFKTSQNAAVAQSAAIASTTGVAVIVTLGAEGAAACLPTRPSLARVEKNVRRVFVGADFAKEEKDDFDARRRPSRLRFGFGRRRARRGHHGRRGRFRGRVLRVTRVASFAARLP